MLVFCLSSIVTALIGEEGLFAVFCLLMCQLFYVSRFTTPPLTAGGQLRSLIVESPGDFSYFP